MNQVTLKTVAEKSGVTPRYVSAILNGDRSKRVSVKTRERVLKIVRELNYSPNPIARSLRTGKTGNIGVTALDRLNLTGMLTFPYISHTLKGMCMAMEQHDYRMVFNNIKEITGTTGNSLSPSGSSLVDGVLHILFAGFAKTFEDKQLPLLNKLSMPFVLIHSLNRSFDCHNVGMDPLLAGRMAADHIREKGYESVGIVQSMLNYPLTPPIVDGFRAGVDPGRITFECTFDPEPHGSYAQHGYELAGRIIRENKTLPRVLFITPAVMADSMLVRFMQEGISIPGDLALVTALSDDDNDDRAFRPVTRVVQPAIAKGMAATELLCKIMAAPEEYKEPRSIKVAPRLIEGISG